MVRIFESPDNQKYEYDWDRNTNERYMEKKTPFLIVKSAQPVYTYKEKPSFQVFTKPKMFEHVCLLQRLK